jgi:hypothetical protein
LNLGRQINAAPFFSKCRQVGNRLDPECLAGPALELRPARIGKLSIMERR